MTPSRTSVPGVALLGLLAAVACSTSPAVHSPLREQLAAAETARVEEASRACLTKGGWKVDPVGSVAGGANVITAYKAKVPVDVYVYPADTKPRVAGGPDYSDPFWKCLAGEMGGSAGAGGKEEGDKPASESAPDAGT